MKGFRAWRLLRPTPPALSAEDTATYWAARKRLRLMTSSDEVAFQRWLSEPRHADAFAMLETTMEDIGALAATPEIRRMREAALAATGRPNGNRWRHLVPLAGLAAAAAFAAVIVVGFIVLRGAPAPVTAAATNQAAPANLAVKRYSTDRGRLLSITLEDGSTVALDTSTAVEVAFSAARRDVRLLQGQASFQVAKNKARPFVVTAGDRRVTAVGTAFNVRIDRDRVNVVLVEGRIVVDPVKPTGFARLIPALSRQELEAGEQLTSAADTQATVTAADVGRATSWERGQLIFREDTIAAAVAEMNRYGATQLIVDDPRVANLRISGVFGTTHQDNFVAALTAGYPITAEPRSHGVIALRWRDEGAENAR